MAKSSKLTRKIPHMNQAEPQHNLDRGIAIIDRFCDDPAWLIRLWMTVPKNLGYGYPEIETTEGAWYKGLEEYVKSK